MRMDTVPMDLMCRCLPSAQVSWLRHLSGTCCALMSGVRQGPASSSDHTASHALVLHLAEQRGAVVSALERTGSARRCTPAARSCTTTCSAPPSRWQSGLHGRSRAARERAPVPSPCSASLPWSRHASGSDACARRTRAMQGLGFVQYPTTCCSLSGGVARPRCIAVASLSSSPDAQLEHAYLRGTSVGKEGVPPSWVPLKLR